MQKKLIFIILDGVADLPVKKLGGRTPLEAAKTPALDRIAKNSKLGLMRVIDKNIPPETDTAVLSMFGYNPLVWNRGRGPLEANGIGKDFREEKDLVLRCNFATKLKGKIIDTEAQRIESKYAKKLVQDIRKKVKLKDATFDFVHDLNYRAVLIIRSSKKLSGDITSTHPGYERKLYGNARKQSFRHAQKWNIFGGARTCGSVHAGISDSVQIIMELPKALGSGMKAEKCRAMDDTEAANLSAAIVNEFTAKAGRVLENHGINIERRRKGLCEANAILARGAGLALPKLKKIRGRWLCIADTPAEKGIAKMLGMKLQKLPEPLTDRLLNTNRQIEKAVRNDMKTRLRVFLKNMDKYDSFYFHFKGADPFGHRDMPEQKKRFIEMTDKYFFKPLLEKIGLKEFLICVTSDHTTACELRTHTADPVPVLIRTETENNGIRFCEKDCGRGSLGTFRAEELMEKLEKEKNKNLNLKTY